jgi:hypothetical protein
MRILKLFISGLLLLSGAAGCRKEKSSETGAPPVDVVETQWEFKESDSLFGGPMDSALLADSDSGNIVVMSGRSTDGQGEITLQLYDPVAIKVGEYPNQNVLFQYSENGITLLENSVQESDPFKVTITAMDSLTISGTFSGIVEDGLGGVKEISEGKFTAPFKGGSDVTPPPLDVTGTLTIWSKATCAGGGKIRLIVADQLGEIMQADAQPPQCGAAGTTSFNLPVGVYTVTGICEDTANYEVTVEPNSCTLLEIAFEEPEDLPGDYFPLANWWSYGDSNNPGDTVKIETQGNTVVDGENYTAFFNTGTQENRYYRKDGSKYFEYVSGFGGVTLDNPIEYLFLQDDLDEGASWETDERTSSSLSPPATFKLKMTIQRKGFNRMINGKMYYDLIEVKTELLIKFGGVFTPTGSQVVTLYAKGIGVVLYQSLDGSPTDWTIRNYEVVP